MVPRAPASGRRLLVIFIDGAGGRALRRAEGAGLLRFLPTLRDGPTHVESRCFSGMPSTTTAFQAGLFYGLRHPDVPSFSWFDRRAEKTVAMNRPGDAADVEARIIEQAGPGLFSGGTSYVSILSGGAGNALSTANLGRKAREWKQWAASRKAGKVPKATAAGPGILASDHAGAPFDPGDGSLGLLHGAHAGSRHDTLQHGAAERLHEPPLRGVADPRNGTLLHDPAAPLSGTLLHDAPPPQPIPWRAKGVVQAQILASMLFRLGTESVDFLATMAKFGAWNGDNRHEFRFLLNHLGVGTAATEMGKGGAILDLVRGVPRTFVCLHEYDEFSHRRGPRDALHVFSQIDAAVEGLFAIASEVPDPPDVWVLTDHGQIPAVPFERLFGRTLADWLAEPTDAALPHVVERLAGEAGPQRPHPPPTVVDCGNYAHVYLGGDRAWDAAEIARLRPDVLARALDCPGVGLVAMRSLRHGAMAFAGGRRVDPAQPGTIPKGATAAGIAALLAELDSSPSSGDLLLCGSWFDDACVAFAWEFSSHGGPSPEETETFVLHPAGLDLSRVAHGADLHATLHALYGAQETLPSA